MLKHIKVILYLPWYINSTWSPKELQTDRIFVSLRFEKKTPSFEQHVMLLAVQQIIIAHALL